MLDTKAASRMQVINCAAWYGQQRRQAVARRDSMAAYPANARNSLEKQVKNRPKKKKSPKKSAPAAGHFCPCRLEVLHLFQNFTLCAPQTLLKRNTRNEYFTDSHFPTL